MADANFASLSPSLLARKGGAKPAMRPQHAMIASMPHVAPSTFSGNDETLEDLGWNDMGEEFAPAPAEPIYLTPAPHNPDAEAEAQANDRAAERQLNDPASDVRRPFVVEQQAELARAVAATRHTDTKGHKPGKRVAFTLRLDAERHLKLKLASTINNCSAQQLVTEALDTLIAKMPEIETLAAQVKHR
ncbi:hypothetical protein D6858_09605 [Tsuneonella suprasediminis]|uniref:Uncharacterized protein n=1 Tax=Tsuneonella suprasediminis TaxID=2306996 RepID=A0A419R2G8_9SPHN|nr:hypothetical protein [Tsuneonella suprasediminis]RJX68156.1 hypothetical protein D6858_09605 [Tsuneonella suprasediminis]